MIHARHIVEAIRNSGVRHIAVIDDVFDVPPIPGDLGGFLDYLEGAVGTSALDGEGLGEARERATEAILNSQSSSEDVQTCWEGLYRAFLRTFEDRFDPAGLFKAAKQANLQNLKPLLVLLRRCGESVKIEEMGSDGGRLDEIGRDLHVIFADFILDASITPDQDVSAGQGAENARRVALARVRELVKAAKPGTAPSIVLMSSHPDRRADAENFRQDIADGDEGRVFKSRFCFVEKTHFLHEPGTDVSVDPQAAHDLLDIVQSFEFGKGVQASLDRWLTAAAKAVADLRRDVEHLDLKDFAYLVRFRLAQEGQELLEYLEWFFGECLLDGIGRRVDEAERPETSTQSPGAGLGKAEADRLQGVVDLPTGKVAELYHRVRIENARLGRRKNYRLGDLYRRTEKDGSTSLLAVMTPDCDLIKRGKGERQAKALLTVSGNLKELGKPDKSGSMADLVKLSEGEFNVSWNKKDVRTWPFDEDLGISADGESICYVGTLRPLYAQQLQRDVIHDLGRVGVSVAPAMTVAGSVTVELRLKGGKRESLEVGGLSSVPCHLVLGRGGQDRTRVLFSRRHAFALVEAVTYAGGERLLSEIVQDADAYRRCLKLVGNARKFDALIATMTSGGLELDAPLCDGVFLATNPRPGSREGKAAWCILVIAGAALADPSME